MLQESARAEFEMNRHEQVCDRLRWCPSMCVCDALAMGRESPCSSLCLMPALPQDEAAAQAQIDAGWAALQKTQDMVCADR